MSLINKIKINIMKKNILKKKALRGFDELSAENFALAEGCDVNYNNSYYFSAHNLLDESLYVRLGQRGDGNDEVWFTYHCKDCTIVNSRSVYIRESSPISIDLVSVGKKINFKFCGKAKLAELRDGVYVGGGEEIDCVVSAEFVATAPIFDFFYHMNESALATAFAREKWTKQFFAAVSENDQTHYEQQGTISAEISFNGRVNKFYAPAIRDHSYGKRDWSFMNNHRWLLCLLGSGQAINLSMVSYPTYKKLEVGNTMIDGKCVCVTSQQSQDDLICDGNIPKQFNIRAQLENGEMLSIDVRKDYEVVYQMGGGEYILHEGVGEFSVNGKRARGIIEYGFNSSQQRWFRG